MKAIAVPEAPALGGQSGGRARSARSALSKTAWHPQSEMSFADWIEQGRKLGVVGRSVAWWIGDWLRYGNAAYGERYSRAARVTGYDNQTLMNMVYVASRFEPERRRDKLSWSHHAEVAARDPSEQDEWLDRAEADRLSVRCLRDEIRRANRLERAAHPRAGHGDESLVCPSCGHSFLPEGDDSSDARLLERGSDSESVVHLVA